MKYKYTVGLQIPTYVWANVDVEADSPEQAQQAALALAHEGVIEDWELADYNTDEATADFVQEDAEVDA